MKIGAGFGVILLRGTTVLLGKRHDDPVKASSALHGEGTWTLPGGKYEFGESFEDGAKREVFEETGIRLNQVDVFSVANNIVPDAHFVTIGLVSTDFTGEPQVLEPDEITEWQWFSLDKLPRPLYFPSEKFLKNYQEGKFYTY